MSNTKNTAKSIKLIFIGIMGIIGLVLCFTMVNFKTVEGSEYGVLETWTGGVSDDILQPKTHILFPGFMKTVYIYDGASRVFVMNDKTSAEEMAEGRKLDAYKVQSQEGQDMTISLNLRWRIDPNKLVAIHKTVRTDIEEKLIRPVLMRIVKDKATEMKAIDAYSGTGLVQLQKEIQDALTGNDNAESDELDQRGIIIENFVIEHIELDPNYIAEIKQKQIATQRTLRAIEEERAAEQEALVAKAVAQADLNTQVVGAERDAKIMVVRAQAENEKVVIAAQAAAEQVTIAAQAKKQQMELEGEGMRLQKTAEAEGILAMGKAEAEAKQLLLDSYRAAGDDAYVQVEVAKHLADGTRNIQGYLPNNFNPTIISGNFMDAIQNILKVGAGVTTSTPTVAQN